MGRKRRRRQRLQVRFRGKESERPSRSRGSRGNTDGAAGRVPLASMRAKKNRKAVRLSLLAGNLDDYLGTIKFMDYDQGEEVRDIVRTIMNDMNEIRNELRRIGINYNQEIRLRQIEAKYRSAKSPMLIGARERERSKVMDESHTLSKDELDALITRYENATREVGEELCRILT